MVNSQKTSILPPSNYNDTLPPEVTITTIER